MQALARSRAGIVEGRPPKQGFSVLAASLKLFFTALRRIPRLPTVEKTVGEVRCYRGLTESLPYHRLFNSPISEAIVGTAGYGLEGGRVLVS